MFFWISKVFASFSHPLTHIFLLVLLALLFYRKPYLAKTCLSLALLLGLLFGTPPLPDALTYVLESRYPRPAEPPRVDAVVVLSGMVDLRVSTPEYLEFGEAVERILAGIDLVQEGYAPTLILAGGNGDLYDQSKREAPLLRQFAIEVGVPETQILVDAESRNTYENAVQTKELMQAHGISQIILVTSASHMPRAMACFRKLGIEPLPYSVDVHFAPGTKYHATDFIPGVGSFRKSSYILHEYIGLLAYKLAGYI